MNKLTPENQQIVEGLPVAQISGAGTEFIAMTAAQFALAIQNATAQKCAEIAMAEYRRTELMNEQYHEGASVELNCSASTATTILHAIREAFGLAPENEEG